MVINPLPLFLLSSPQLYQIMIIMMHLHHFFIQKMVQIHVQQAGNLEQNIGKTELIIN